jgi:hypothetical protein
MQVSLKYSEETKSYLLNVQFFAEEKNDLDLPEIELSYQNNVSFDKEALKKALIDLMGSVKSDISENI